MVRRRAGGASGLVVFVFLAWAQQAAEAAETCSARGFSGLQLCSDCEIFAQHVRSSKGKRGRRERTRARACVRVWEGVVAADEEKVR